MDGVFALGCPVNEDIKIVSGFGGNGDKLLVPAEIIYKGRISLRGICPMFANSSSKQRT